MALLYFSHAALGLASGLVAAQPGLAQHAEGLMIDAPPVMQTGPHAEADFPQDADPHCADDIGYHDGWVDGGLRFPTFEELGFRHSSYHGRWFGRGQPLTGTSWLNRPYEFGFELGAFVMTDAASSNTHHNNDILGAAHLGWDWDHYWGSQLRIAWTTPDLSPAAGTTQRDSNDLLIYDVSMLYYPWGDSRVRPYYRFGVGLTDLDFVNSLGIRESETLFTIPVGIGIKYQTKRWMAFRAEAVDNITFGQNLAHGMQNWTLTFGLEWRFGGRPSGTWSSPSQYRTW